MPGMPNVHSTITLPPISPGSDSARIVTIGRSALRSACFRMTTASARPFARADWM